MNATHLFDGPIALGRIVVLNVGDFACVQHRLRSSGRRPLGFVPHAGDEVFAA